MERAIRAAAAAWMLMLAGLAGPGPFAAPVAWAQTGAAGGQDGGTDDQGGTGEGAGADASMTSGPSTAGQLVTIEVEQFGFGDIIRECDWAGVSLIFSDPSADKPRNVAVRLAIKDDDGDTQYCERRMALSMASRLRTWLYFRVPKSTQGTSVFTVTVHEIIDAGGSGGDPGAPGGAGGTTAADGGGLIGKQLSFARFTPKRVLAQPNNALVGVIGRRPLGLEQYELRSRDGQTMPTSNEVTEVITGLSPKSLPDQWQGLAAYETLVWAEGGPEEMEDPRPQSLREWVNRGGHLVIVLPPVGSTWFSPSNPASDMMPSVTVERHEDQSLEPYRALFTGLSTTVLPGKSVVQSMVPLADTGVAEATEVLSGPHGCIAARRLVGTGMVTVIGLDLSAGMLPNGGLRADHFWHRILGKRFDTPVAMDSSQFSGGVLGPGAAYADAYVPLEIAKQRAAGVGVLLGLLVFAAYWFVAGPGGFGLLKMRKMIHHAWVGFSLTTLLFTLIAWTGATALRPRKVEAQHLTYLTHVYGQAVQSARLWASVQLPNYGDRDIRVGRPEADTGWRQAMCIWSNPIGQGSPTPFPDARAYALDSRSLWHGRVPARDTTKMIQGDWLGGPAWSMPKPANAGETPRLIRTESRVELAGTLVHELPGELTDLTIVLVSRQTSQARQQIEDATKTIGIMPCEAYAWSLPSWKPGEALPLASFSTNGEPLFEKLAEKLVPTTELGLSTAPSSLNPTEARRYHDMAAWYSMLPPPQWNDTSKSPFARKAQVIRVSAQGLDLGKWFTQPCLIIVGHLSPGPSPVPLFVDGQACDTSGRTVVRWVFPFPSHPPRFPPGALEATKLPKAKPQE